ncbi:MAG: S1 RNA-binding domain-containing protein [Candidatus Shikimatogenerans sp. Tser]|uniref:S1 RNA-binding domain-containing protein n=1 Tax=Candidatus Shikimatogenerans sp. Tser TaxID=3158568 RepID=A0AAU7QQU1_9FLAO
MGYILKIEKCIYAFLPNDRLINNYKYNIKSFIKIFIININFKKKNIIVSNKNFYYYENFNKKILKYGFYNNKIILGKIKNKNNDKFIVKINNNIKGIFLKKKNIKNKIEINKNYKFKILKINFNKKNIKLGLKNVKNIFLNKIINKNFKIGDIIWGKIYKINNYSIKLIVEKYYIKAVIPITELFWEFDIKKHKEKIKIGDVLKCIIIDINFFKKEIILSHKRLIHNNVL